MDVNVQTSLSSHIHSYKNPREFFLALCWEYNTGTSLSVYSEDEIVNQPLKWLKYLLLERVGATSIIELNSTIFRYKWEERDSAQKKCKELINNLFGNNLMIVVKVVYKDKAGQLPNFRIYSEQDIVNVFLRITASNFQAEQLWLCISSVNQEGTNLGGRVTYTNKSYAPWIAEIIWFTSPRRIEEYKTIGFEFPFLRAYKNPASLIYEIAELYIPKKYQKQRPRTEYLQDFQFVLLNLAYFRESLEKLDGILFGAGAKEISIEFKISAGKFSIIDWDTEIETSIIG
jgi:hypothetical protein